MVQIAAAPVNDSPRSCSSMSWPASAHHRDGSLVRFTEAASTTQSWMFELRPSHELPVVDLSVSIKSRFLSPRMSSAFTKMISFRRTLFAIAIFSLMGYPVSLAITPSAGVPLALITMTTSIPLAFAAISLLRYEVVKLLLTTYDTVFFLGMATTTLVAVGMIVQDARTGGLVTTLIGLMPNIFVDANLRAVRRFTLVTGIEILAMIVVVLEVLLDAIPEAHTEVTIASYGTHVLLAKMYALNGFPVLIVMLLRNVYRNRKAVLHRRNPSLQHCVTYRVRLKLGQVDTSKPRSSVCFTESVNIDSTVDMTLRDTSSLVEAVKRQTSNHRADGGDGKVAYMQRLRYSRTHRCIDARNTVARTAFLFVAPTAVTASIRRMQISTVVFFRSVIISALVASVLALPIDRRLIDADRPPIVQYFALLLTATHFGSVVMLSQRDLLRAVVTSFDFGYLSVHIVLLSLCMCDFFRWGQHSIIVFVACLWLHALMCGDALTPPVRERMGIQMRGTAVLLAIVSLGSTGVIIYLLIIDPDTSTSIHDRVLWTGKVPGASQVVVTLASMFYSGLFTAFLLIVRLLYRVATYANNELVLIDGPVVFTNCFHRQRALAQATTASSPRSATMERMTRDINGSSIGH